MTLEIVIIVILPLIEQITQGIKNLPLLVKVDTRIIAFVIATGFAFLLHIDLVAMSGPTGALAWVTTVFPVWVYLTVSGFLMSLGSRGVNWIFNKTNINKNATAQNIADSQARAAVQE
jgi:hypothetical protein